MTVAIRVVVVIGAGLVTVPTAVRGQAVGALATSDSAAILHAAWRVTTRDYNPRRPLSLWAPSTPDTGSIGPPSSALRAALLERQMPVFERQPTGDDTVVFRVTGWQVDSAGLLLEFRSAWTTILGAGDRRCRTGSGNVEHVRVHWQAGEWQAERVGPVLHGDRLCHPIAPAPTPTHGRPNRE